MDDLGPYFFAILSSTVIASAVTGLITWRVQTKTLAQTRLVETTRLALDLAAIGMSRDPNGSAPRPIGVSEQLAAISSCAALGRAYPPLRETAKSYLDGHIQVFNKPDDLSKMVFDLATRERKKF